MKAIVAGLLFAAACMAQSVTIVNSGSTNRPGFRIVVEKSGEANYTRVGRRVELNPPRTPRQMHKTLPEALMKRFFADVSAAVPLASLPPRHCMKSASFGYRLTILVDSDESPDLSCGDGGNAKLRALIADTGEIVKIFETP